MELKFRKAIPTDFDAILRLKKQVHNFHSSNRPDFYTNSDSPIEKTEFESMLENKNSYIFVAESGAKIYGYAIAKVLCFENNPLIVNHKRLFIDDMCVDPDYRKMGIGSIIMKNLDEVCKSSGYQFLDLNVWNFNTDAIEFYRKSGMNVTIMRMEKAIR